MQVVQSLLDPLVINCLKEGGIVVARTDTLYGVLARADDETAVERVFAVKGRSNHKSPIVLISSREQMFVPLPKAQAHLADDMWPGPVTIAVPVDKSSAPSWLHRGNDEFGHRLPAKDDLHDLIDRTGPLIAPSANPERSDPAMNISQAIDYFGDKVDIYVDGGEVIDPKPSKLLRIDEQGNIERLR